MVGGYRVCLVGMFGTLAQVLGYKYLQVGLVLITSDWTPFVGCRLMNKQDRKDQCFFRVEKSSAVAWKSFFFVQDKSENFQMMVVFGVLFHRLNKNHCMIIIKLPCL